MFKISLKNNKVFKNSLIYIFTDFLNKSLPFLLLPILTKYLSPADFGIIASFNSLKTVLIIFIGLNITSAINVNFFHLSKKELSVYISNSLIIVSVTFLVSLVILLLFKNDLVNYLNMPLQWLLMAFLVAPGMYLITVNLTLWLAEQLPKSYGIFQLSQTLLILLLSLFFIICLRMGWQGRILAISIGVILFAIISLYFLNKRGYISFNYNLNYIKEALSFGIPLIPHTLSSWLRNGAIIFVLVHMVGVAQTGLFDVGNKIALLISILAMAINKAWSPYLFRVLSKNPDEQQKRKIVSIILLLFIGLIVMAFMFTISSRLLVELFLDRRFYDSYKFIGWQSFGAAFYGMYIFVVNFIFYAKKTKYVAYITFTISAINIIIAYVLIRINGTIGAAQANTISFALSFLFVWYYSNKVYKMPWNKFLIRP